MTDQQEQITQWLNQEQIDEKSWNQVLPLVYHQLKHLARKVKSDNKATPTLNTTALVHDVYIKIKKNAHLSITGTQHFYRIAAQAMRQIITDAARAKLSNKRKGQAVEWEDEFVISLVEQTGTSANELIAIDHALTQLKSIDSNKASIVELHFFAGYSFEHIATMLEVSESTVFREWKKARAWLYSQLM